MSLHDKTIASMKGIALDSINQAGQGHIGMAIGAAPITYTLIGTDLNFSQKDPKWINRDRLVMSAGHGSMAMYSIYHFMGLLTIDDMKAHKTYDAPTPSHPEIDALAYVDASTGPLGQGVAMGVGMAISQRYLADRYNRPNFPVFDHQTYVLVGDGCLQEGVALEAIQLAGTMQLRDLVILQDYNGVQIDSRADEVNRVDLEQYFIACGFDVHIVKTPTVAKIKAALDAARASAKPTFIQVHTIIAQDTPVADQSQGHNGVLDQTTTLDFKQKIGLSNQKPFQYDQDVYDYGHKLMQQKDAKYDQYQTMWQTYQTKFPQAAKEIIELADGNYHIPLGKIKFEEHNVATRNYFIPIMQQLDRDHRIVGGSADLAAATKIKFATDLVKGGKNIKYGIREHAMVAINNGIYLHAHLRTIDATFLVFSDYAKPAYRLGSLMDIPSLHVLTHDSYQVGGDGPTHQPFDQLPMLRAIHKSVVMRPADESEMRLCFDYALNHNDRQAFIIACRQPIPSFNKIKGNTLPKGYRVLGFDHHQGSIVATGSEVGLAVEVAKYLDKHHGLKVQVISAPLLKELLQDKQLLDQLEITSSPIFGLEASNDAIWYQFAQFNRFACWLANGYGNSAPGDQVYARKGFTVPNIVAKVRELLKSQS